MREPEAISTGKGMREGRQNWLSLPVTLATLLLVNGVATGSALATGSDGIEGQPATQESPNESDSERMNGTEADQDLPAENPFLTLGTEQGVGGKDFMKYDRGRIKDQILRFIPPLLQPAFTGHAFVLPPGTWRISMSARFTSISGDDFFMAGEPNQATFRDFEVSRRFIDLDVFYGFDLNRRFLHGLTLRVNVPYRDSSTDGALHPNGVSFLNLLASGSTQTIGDIGVFVKKKVLDQGNAPFGLAVAGAVSLPTGSNDEKFGNDGFILAKRPDPDGDGVQASFDSVIQARGGPQNFFNGAWHVPADMLENAPQTLRFLSTEGSLAASLGTGAYQACCSLGPAPWAQRLACS